MRPRIDRPRKKPGSGVSRQRAGLPSRRCGIVARLPVQQTRLGSSVGQSIALVMRRSAVRARLQAPVRGRVIGSSPVLETGSCRFEPCPRSPSGCSSMEESATFNGHDGGSSPPRPDHFRSAALHNSVVIADDAAVGDASWLADVVCTVDRCSNLRRGVDQRTVAAVGAARAVAHTFTRRRHATR